MEDAETPDTGNSGGGGSGWLAAVAALASGGLALAGNAANKSAIKSTNEANIRNSWAHTFYDNFYNSPKEQRRRMVEAGLNPALMYGKMGTGESSSQPARLEAPVGDYSALAGMGGQYAAIRSTQLQADNMAKQQEVMDSTIALQASQAAKNASDTAKTSQETNLARETMQSSIDFAKNQVDLQKAEQGLKKAQTSNTDKSTDLIASNIKLTDAKVVEQDINNSNLKEKWKQDLKEQYWRIENAYSQWQNSQTQQKGMLMDNEIKKMETLLARYGVTKNDPLYTRLMTFERIRYELRTKKK